MKRAFYIASLLAIPALSQGQPTINHMYDYTIGNTSKTMICDNANIGPGNAGGNQQWIFTNLQVTDSVIQNIIDPSATPFASSFPTATFAVRSSQGTFTYFQQTGTESQMLGFADSFSGYTIVYNDPVLRAKRPFSYNNSATDTFWMAGSTSNGHGTVAMTADGWGSLQLPNGSYSNVLRVKSVYYEFDSLNTGSSPVTTELMATTYTWFDDTYSDPLLTWDSTHILNSIGSFSVKTLSYLKSSTATGIKNINRNLALTAFMKQGQLCINGQLDAAKNYSVQLIAMDGKQVLSLDNIRGAERLSLPVRTYLAAGTYLVFLSDNAGNFGTVKLNYQ